MRDAFLLSGLLLATFALGVLVGSRRERMAARRRAEREADRRAARLWRTIRCRPSPVTLTLHGMPTDAHAADFLARMFGGSSHTVEG